MENFNKRTLNHFNFLKKLVREFEKSNIFYSVLGGFSVDAQIGKLTRDHPDLDIAILEKDKSKVIETFEEKFPEYKLFKNYAHKISFSKQGMLIDFLLLKNKDNKLKLEFSWDRDIPEQDETVFMKKGAIDDFQFNVPDKDFLIILLKRFCDHRNKKKTKEDLLKLVNK